MIQHNSSISVITGRPNVGYLPSIDGLRVVAVTFVIWTHVARPHWFVGAVGLDIFFVLSGYLITTILSPYASGHDNAGRRPTSRGVRARVLLSVGWWPIPRLWTGHRVSSREVETRVGSKMECCRLGRDRSPLCFRWDTYCGYRSRRPAVLLACLGSVMVVGCIVTRRRWSASFLFWVAASCLI